MKLLCSLLLGYYLLAFALCKAQPTGHVSSDPTSEDSTVNNVLSTPHLQPLVSEPYSDKQPDETASQLQFLDKYRYYNKEEKEFEFVYLSLCKQFPETDKAAWGAVVDNAYILRRVSFFQLDSATALEKSLVHRSPKYEYPSWCLKLREEDEDRPDDIRKEARDANRKDVRRRIRREVQAAKSQQGQLEHEDDQKMDKLVLSLLLEGHAARVASKYLNYFEAFDVVGRSNRLDEYLMMKVEDPSKSRTDKIKQYLSEASSQQEISLFKILEKSEILQHARVTTTRVNRRLKEKNASLRDVDDWMVKLLSGSPGMEDMDQENIKIAFVKARAILNLELAIENSLPSAVGSLLADHESFPENLLARIVRKALKTQNMAIITSLFKHPSFTEKVFNGATEGTFQGHFKPEMIHSLLTNEHTHRFNLLPTLNEWYNKIEERYSKNIAYKLRQILDEMTDDAEGGNGDESDESDD